MARGHTTRTHGVESAAIVHVRACCARLESRCTLGRIVGSVVLPVARGDLNSAYVVLEFDGKGAPGDETLVAVVAGWEGSDSTVLCGQMGKR